jgi:hypothetical protein
MHDEQHLDVVVDLLRVGFDLAHIEKTLQLRADHPRLHGLLLRHRVERAPEHRQRAHQADHRFLRRSHLRDRARDVVLEQAFAVRRQHRNRRLLVEERHGEPEVELLPGIRHLPFDVVERRGLLGIRVGLGIEALDDELAACGGFVFVQEVFHALRKSLQTDRNGVTALRVVEADANRRVELCQDRARTRRECVDVAFGQVGARVERADDEVRGDEDREQRNDPAGRIPQYFAAAFHVSESLPGPLVADDHTGRE